MTSYKKEISKIKSELTDMRLQNKRAFKIWLIASDVPVEFNIPFPDQIQLHYDLCEAIEGKEKIFKIKEYCFVLDKITLFKIGEDI